MAPAQDGSQPIFTKSAELPSAPAHRGSVAGRLADFRSSFENRRFTSFDSRIGLIAAILLYLAITAIWASRYLWFDELMTYYIAKAPSLSRLGHELSLDLNPPLSYLAVRASLAVLGDNAYAARFPSIVAFLTGSLCLYRFLSRRLRPVYGLLGLLVFWATPFLYYATEARPYAFIVGFFGIAMLAMERAIQPARSKWSIALLAVAITGMMLSHVFGVLYIAPFCLAELWRWHRTRKFDWPIWAVLIVPVGIPLIYLSMVSRFEATLFPTSFQAGPRKILGFFFYTLYPGILAILPALCLGLLVGLRRQRRGTNGAIRTSAIERAFTVGLFAIPFLIVVALMRSHGAFFPRYGAPTVLGYALVSAFLLAKYTNANRLAATVSSCILFVFIVCHYLVPLALEALPSHRAAAAAKFAAIERVEPALPLVAAGGVVFVETDKYAAPETVARLYYLTDRELAAKYAHATMFEGLAKLKKYFPIRATVEPYREFIKNHPRFLVVGLPNYPEDWLLRELIDIHAKMRQIGNFSGPYDTQIYEVTMPGS